MYVFWLAGKSHKTLSEVAVYMDKKKEKQEILSISIQPEIFSVQNGCMGSALKVFHKVLESGKFNVEQ